MKSNLVSIHSTASHRLLGTAAKVSKITARRTTQSWVLACVLALLTGVAAEASDPVGIYAMVDKVVLEPNEYSPERIRIVGLFSLAIPGGAGDIYSAPQPGYLYYTVTPGKKAVCEREWADLKAIAGSRQCVAFGSRHHEKGRVRKADEKPASPDTYPIAQGITKVKASDYPPVKKLYDAASASGRSDLKPAGESSAKGAPAEPRAR